MHGGSALTLLHLSVIVQSYSGVQTIITDLATAKRVVDNRGTIWEPTPPSDEYFVLGQHFHGKSEPPPSGTELIVGRSEDGSLKEPLDFYGKWQITQNLVVWSMRCPDRFVSLGAIATAKDEKPDVAKYRCVKLEETYKAKMWSQVHSNVECQLRTIYAEKGWRNNFFLVQYNRLRTTTKAYTLKSDPVNQTEQTDVPEKPKKNPTSRNISIIPTDFPEESHKNPKNGDTSIQSYTVLIISTGFVLLIIIIFVTLFCVKSNRTKLGEVSTTVTSTALTALDSGLPSNVSVSSSDASMNGSSGFRGRNIRVASYGNMPGQRRNESVTRYNEIYQPQSEEFEVRDNLLYHNLHRVLSEENEYQTIHHAEALGEASEGRSQVFDEAAEPYSFAV